MLQKNVWESEFFAKQIYKLDPTKWDRKEFAKLVSHIKPDVVEIRISANEISKINELMAAKFRLYDVVVDFEKTIQTVSKVNESEPVVLAREDDTEELKGIASEAFVHSRFDDSIFGFGAKQNVYSEWVSNAVMGTFDDVCLIISDDEEIKGFATCRLGANNNCRIGLIAVKQRYQGEGLGKTLLKTVEHYARTVNKTLINVATQSRNEAALSLYNKGGFSLNQIDLWLYWA